MFIVKFEMEALDAYIGKSTYLEYISYLRQE